MPRAFSDFFCVSANEREKKMTGFAEQLAAARKAAGMTQEQLAEAVHVARNTVSTWEHGRSLPNIEMMQTLGQTLHTDFLSSSAATGAETDKNEDPSVKTEEERQTGAESPGRKPLSRRIKRIIALAALAAVICACLLIFLPKNSASAVLDVHAMETPVLMMENRDMFEGDGRGWMFTFEILNTSTVPFKPESATVVFYAGEGIDSKLQMSYDDMLPWMDTEMLRQGDTPLQLLFGTNHTDCTHAVCIIRGTDQNGHELTFEGRVELSQEKQE